MIPRANQRLIQTRGVYGNLNPLYTNAPTGGRVAVVGSLIAESTLALSPSRRDSPPLFLPVGLLVVTVTVAGTATYLALPPCLLAHSLS